MNFLNGSFSDSKRQKLTSIGFIFYEQFSNGVNIMKQSAKISRSSISRQKPLRPTTGKVREALFNIVRTCISNTYFLDLYAGTGAVGIEALRQGAADVVFVEANRSRSKKISGLVNKYRFTERARIVTKKALPFIEWAHLNLMTFDIIFLDPPYHNDEIVYALSAIGKYHVLKKEGILIAEHFAKKQLPERSGNLYKEKEYAYGDSVLSLYKEFR